jgi:hypothetical protein
MSERRCSVFETIEAAAYSRDMSWSQYTNLHHSSGTPSRLLMPDEWQAFKHMMELCDKNERRSSLQER